MITKQLFDPKSIVIIGASDELSKPGGKVLKNLVDGGFKRDIFLVNPKKDEVQGIKTHQLEDLPNVDLAIIAIAAKFVSDTVKFLTEKKNTKAFIVLSAGFSEENEAGAQLENELLEYVNKAGASLIGPNCTGIITPNYHGIFTLPIPKLDPKGCDFISGSGATACFIMESGIAKGLTFSRVISVGNSAQLGVEEFLEYFDQNFDPQKDSKIKLLYIETISKPQKLLKHARSLIQKGCKIAAIKAGSSDAGSRAASSHTGALASSDSAVDALFKKAGIVRCYGREELISVASVFTYPELTGKNVAVITHAGGPGVMMTDALSDGGLEVPPITGKKAEELLEQLFPGSSVANPIDFLATGTAEQLETIIDYCDKHFKNIDGMAVIFGTPGLTKLFHVYDVLDKKMAECKKPVFPIMPSLLTAKEEMEEFISKGRVIFTDETELSKAVAKVFKTPKPVEAENVQKIETTKIRKIIGSAKDGEYLEPDKVKQLLDAAGIKTAEEAAVNNEINALKNAEKFGFPVVMKVVGAVHKSDVGGVVLNIKNADMAKDTFNKLMKIDEATGVLIQPMHKGIELFAGAKYEPKFGHMILCGLGGIFVEVLKDVSMGLAPLSNEESLSMIRNIKAYDIIRGVRGKKGINEKVFVDIIARLSALTQAAPEIEEMDINPLLASGDDIVAVDARIKIVFKA